MIHKLKILPDYLKDVMSGEKMFELRKFDRPYKTGDTLILREWKSGSGYTGRFIRRKIKYILSECPEYGLEKGYCILGLE